MIAVRCKGLIGFTETVKVSQYFPIKKGASQMSLSMCGVVITGLVDAKTCAMQLQKAMQCNFASFYFRNKKSQQLS